LIENVGGIGVGFVWGWLLGTVSTAPRRAVRTPLLAGGATVLVALEMDVLAGRWALPSFLGGTALALSAHVGFLRYLQTRALRDTGGHDGV
jgi:hypothetical protein